MRVLSGLPLLLWYDAGAVLHPFTKLTCVAISGWYSAGNVCGTWCVLFYGCPFMCVTTDSRRVLVRQIMPLGSALS